MGGYGTSRGRRPGGELRVGDSLDFWKDVVLVPGRKIQIFSQMKLPGKGWLELNFNKDKFIVSAHGLWGRLYWYFMYPPLLARIQRYCGWHYARIQKTGNLIIFPKENYG